MLCGCDARAARVGAEDQDVCGRRTVDTQLEINRAVGVGNHEFGHRVDVEAGTLGRSERRLEALTGQSRIDFHEEQIAGETSGFTETGVAAGVLVARHPRGALVLGQGAPQGPDAAKGCPSAGLGGAGAFARNGVAATVLSIPALDADERALLT